MEKEIIHMSLSDLLKKSAMQICYLRRNEKKRPPATKEQIEGSKAAIDKAIDEKYIEMRGTYAMEYIDKKILIHYAFDEISPSDTGCLLIEHKNIKSGSNVELWYRNASILQTAVYQAFAKENDNKHLETACFYIEKGNPKIEFNIKGLNLYSQLHFGNWIYSIHTPKSKKLIHYYKQKAIATLDYNTAKDWDDMYKRKDFDMNHSYISYRELQKDNTIKIK